MFVSPLSVLQTLPHQLKANNGTVCLSAERVSNGKCRASTLNASNGTLNAIPNEEKLLIFTEMEGSPPGRIIWLQFWVSVLIKLPRLSTPPVGFIWHLVRREKLV